MAKRRNKNKKAGPVKIIRPAEAAAPETSTAVMGEVETAVDPSVVEQEAAPAPDEATLVPASDEVTPGPALVDAVAMDAAPEAASDSAAGSEDEMPASDSDAAMQDLTPRDAVVVEAAQEVESIAALSVENAAADDAMAGNPGEVDETVAEEIQAVPAAVAASETEPDTAPDTGTEGAPAPMPPVQEFDDASALLAQSVEVVQEFGQSARAIESIAIPGASAEASDVSAAAFDEPAGDEAATAAPRKSGRTLKLSKLQRHQRSEIPAEPEPEPAVAVEDERKAPAEPRIAAFAKLTEYQALSLAHVPGLPEEADVPGHWRGVGFGIGSRRFVAGFDEVVEVIRMPQVTHVPGTQPWMLGVANVRGTLLPVVDLKQFLEGERTVVYEGQRVMVVRQSGGNVAVLIDQLFGQRTFNDSHKVDKAADGGTRYDHFIRQVYRVGDSDWGVFSMAMLTRTPEFRQAAA